MLRHPTFSHHKGLRPKNLSSSSSILVNIYFLPGVEDSGRPRTAQAQIFKAAVSWQPDSGPRKTPLSIDFLYKGMASGLSLKTEDSLSGDKAETLLKKTLSCCGHSSLLFLDGMAQ